jgi:hypothetical protein
MGSSAAAVKHCRQIATTKKATTYILVLFLLILLFGRETVLSKIYPSLIHSTRCANVI